LLKLTELPVQELGGLAPGAQVIGHLTREVQMLRDDLTRKVSVRPSTDTRRAGRAAWVKAGYASLGGQGEG